MRESGLGDDTLFPGAATQYRDLYDQQLANMMVSGRGLGLQDAIRRQLGVSPGTPPTDPATTPAAAGGLPLALRRSAEQCVAGVDASQPAVTKSAAAARINAYAPTECTPEEFVARIWPQAVKAAAALGVPAKTLVAQAALETGWGRKTVRGAGGEEAHNLFGIKATGNWRGGRVTATTTEYAGGATRREAAGFRAYGSPDESFADYVGLLKGNPRYADALNSGGDGTRFAQALQQAGYATDPQYAAKLSAIAEGPTLRRALAGLEGAADDPSLRA